ncbi:peptidase S8/S53 domain-containing protein [Cyathus striatus]|nr:peptidase S8/S53 domain-containing protein [Cyathus striatus]
MSSFSTLLAFVALCTTAFCRSIPNGWDFYNTDSPPDHVVTLHIGVKQQSFDKLVDNLYEVSDPDHERYGQYLSKEEVENLVRPHHTSLDAVDQWLKHAGVDISSVERTPAKDWVSITVPVSLAENSSGQVQHVPSSFHWTHGRSSLSSSLLKAPGSRETVPSGPVPQSCNDPDGFITPACLRDFYHFSNYVPKTELDVETIMALTHPTPVEVYSVGQSAEPDNQNEAFLSWALFTLNQTNPPSVISTSFADNEVDIPIDYANRLCNAIAQLGARGISVIFGSGDGGVDNNVDCSAITNATAFQPSFPGGCPFITSVGGTQGFNPERAVGGPNSTANYRGSGAGFSNYFPRPKYQDEAVAAYLKKLGTKYTGLFNATGRAFPDISAQSSNFPIIDNGEVFADSGTSASGPVVAAIISLLNDYRLSIGKPPLGFLNPWLYSKGFEGLNDILIGRSEGCDERGFDASTGWDPVTGLGTPDFVKLQKLV